MLIAITGVGAVTAAGVGAGAVRTALRRGRSLLGPLPESVAGGLSMRTGGRMDFAAAKDRALEASVLAAREALARARIDPARTALALGTALAAIDDGGAVAPDALTRALAARLDLGGPARTFSVTCASSLYALEQACADLEAGRAEGALCGGVDTLGRFMQAGFCSLAALSDEGLVLGEAAAFLALEPLERAVARHAHVLAVIAGRALRADAMHLSSPDEAGRGMTAAVRAALAEAGRSPADVAVVSLTAHASPSYAKMYDHVLADVFERERPRTATWEPVLGHVLAATGALGLVNAVQTLEDVAGDVLALTVGFGGQNGATLLRRPTAEDRRPGAAVAAPARGGARIVAAAEASGAAGAALEDLFPGRWDRRRLLPEAYRAIVGAVAAALEQAGWWRPGSGAAVDGGLVLGLDRCPEEPVRRFRAAPSPVDFLHALPSTAAATAGMLFGLGAYQATVTAGDGEAEAHARDVIGAGRARRLVAAAAGAGGVRAICLEAEGL